MENRLFPLIKLPIFKLLGGQIGGENIPIKFFQIGFPVEKKLYSIASFQKKDLPIPSQLGELQMGESGAEINI
jgi:hypothetical protein